MSSEIRRYSDARAERGEGAFEPWDLETLVLAQRMACDGKDVSEIAEALGRNVADVAERLDPREARRVRRPERAGVAFGFLKGR